MLQDNQKIIVVGIRSDGDGVWPISRVRDRFGQSAVDKLEEAGAARKLGCMFEKVQGDRATYVMLTIQQEDA